MTEAPRGFDCSFLNEEEARKILQVLERNEQLQRVEKDRIRYRALSFPFAGLLERGVRGAPAGDLATGAARSGGRCDRDEAGAASFSLKDSGMPG
jgi:hypothetical protein